MSLKNEKNQNNFQEQSWAWVFVVTGLELQRFRWHKGQFQQIIVIKVQTQKFSKNAQNDKSAEICPA